MNFLEYKNKPYFVAELSCNHLGDMNRCCHLIQQAARAGADAVKLQCWSPGEMVIDRDFHIESGTWHGMNLKKLYKDNWTPWAWYNELFNLASFLNITIFCSVFDQKALEFLEKSYPCAMYKISSFELTDLELIRAVAKTGKPIILSTGMATKAEIVMAIDAAVESGNEDIILLKCVSKYPTQFYEAGLKDITRMQQQFKLKVGLSDHCLTPEPTIAATALGAVMIEKHFTLNREDGGPDASFSVEPMELREQITDARRIASTLNDTAFETEQDTRLLRRSLYVVNHVSEGEIIQAEDLGAYRPARGLPPWMLSEVVGKRASRDLKPNTPLRTGDYQSRCVYPIDTRGEIT